MKECQRCPSGIRSFHAFSALLFLWIWGPELRAEFRIVNLIMTASAEAEIMDGTDPASRFLANLDPNESIEVHIKDRNSRLPGDPTWMDANLESVTTRDDDTLEVYVSGNLRFRAANQFPFPGTGVIDAETTVEFEMPADEVLWDFRIYPESDPHATVMVEATLEDLSSSELIKTWSGFQEIQPQVFSNKRGHILRLQVRLRAALAPPSGVGSTYWEASVRIRFTEVDCNANGVYDPTDIASKTSTDDDRNDYPDDCNSPVIYVNREAAEGGDGSSWATAFRRLDDALDLARTRDDRVIPIWITGWPYIPQRRLVESDPRSATFRLPPNVYLHGGFVGTESALSDRPSPIGRTLLSGDLLGDDGGNFSNRSDNARHVLLKDYPDREGDLLLDSINVRGGHADETQYNFGAGLLAYGPTTLINCGFTDNWSGPASAEGSVAHSNGGGAVAVIGDIYMDYDNPGKADVNWEDCSFVRNHSTGTGGGVFLSQISVRFSNCHFEDNRAQAGGAMGFEPLSKLFFDNCTFRNNTATSYGGAIVGFYGLFEFIVSRCHFEGNTSNEGGALWVEDGADNLEVTDSSFSSNQASILDGGAMRWHGSHSKSVKIAGCSFFANRAGGSGGALAMGDGSATLSRCDFSANRATDGGAISAYDLQLTLEDSNIEGNHATIGGGIVADNSQIRADRCRYRQNYGTVGGAVSVTSDSDESTFSGSLFHENSADLYGGAIAGGAGGLIITHSTIVDNISWGLAAGILTGPETVIEDSILWNNNLAFTTSTSAERVQIEGSPVVWRSIVQGWTGRFSGEDSSGLDPQFVNPTGDYGWYYGEKNFRLGPTSPARHAGNPEFIPEFGEADLDGHARVLCGRVDMGAYESGFGDGDCDGEVNTWDFAVWVACVEGEVEGAACETMDSDVDGDFDLKDFAAIQIAW